MVEITKRKGEKEEERKNGGMGRREKKEGREGGRNRWKRKGKEGGESFALFLKIHNIKGYSDHEKNT